MPTTTFYTRHASKLGPLLFLAREGRLTGLYFADQRQSPAIDPGWRHDDDALIFRHVRREVDEFLAGERQSFNVPFSAMGTPFQKMVWREIAEIPFNATRSYGDLAMRLGGFARAVGMATGRNPLSLVVPCHRVVGSSGALTGYAGGLDRKRWLLELEQRQSVASCALATA